MSKIEFHDPKKKLAIRTPLKIISFIGNCLGVPQLRNLARTLRRIDLDKNFPKRSQKSITIVSDLTARLSLYCVVHINFFKTNIVQNLKQTLCTMLILKSEHLEHGFVLLHLVSVFQITKISLFEQNITDRQTDRQTRFTHLYP